MTTLQPDYRPRRLVPHGQQVTLTTSLHSETQLAGRHLERLLTALACVVVGTVLGLGVMRVARTLADHLRPIAAVATAEHELERVRR